MIALAIIIWLIIGTTLSLMNWKKNVGYVTVGDFVCCVLMGTLGPLAISLFIIDLLQKGKFWDKKIL